MQVKTYSPLLKIFGAVKIVSAITENLWLLIRGQTVDLTYHPCLTQFIICLGCRTVDVIRFCYHRLKKWIKKVKVYLNKLHKIKDQLRVANHSTRALQTLTGVRDLTCTLYHRRPQISYLSWCGCLRHRPQYMALNCRVIGLNFAWFRHSCFCLTFKYVYSRGNTKANRRRTVRTVKGCASECEHL